MNKIEINRLASIEGGTDPCLFAGFAVGFSILAKNPFSFASAMFNAYSKGCLSLEP